MTIIANNSISNLESDRIMVCLMRDILGEVG